MARKNYGLTEDAKKWVEDVKKGQVGTPKPTVARPTRKVSMTAAGKIRARSVGVSSSSRQRTNKRGPANRKRKKTY
jgi:hypothetical protein